MPNITSPSTSSHVARNSRAGMALATKVAELKELITSDDNDAVLERLSKADFSPETWQDLLAHALKPYNWTITETIVRHPACPPDAALDVAVQHNSINTVTEALRRGADPEKIAARPASAYMGELLNYARRVNKLYPPNASRDQQTFLDCNLRNGVHNTAARDMALRLLNEKIAGKNLQEAWRDAVKEKQVDVQRAILLLRADKERGFRLKQEDAVTDKGVAEVMKEVPYFPPKRGQPLNFNTRDNYATFPGTKEQIACRHLVEHRQAMQETSDKIKFDNAQFASTEAIASHVSDSTGEKYLRLIAHAKETHLFHNRHFGKTLVGQLEAMALKGETSRLILLTSVKHTMGVGLKIKKKDGKPHYVTELYDPNFTTSHVRTASDSLRTFETLKLENFIGDELQYKKYYPQSNGVSIMYVRPSPEEQTAMMGRALGAIENRTLTSCIEDKDVDETVVFHMLKRGFAGDLRRLKNEIASRPVTEQIKLLLAESGKGFHGLQVALQFGHTDAVKAFGELLDLVPPRARAAILANTAIGAIFLEKKPEMLNALDQFIEIVKKTAPELSAPERSDLLTSIKIDQGRKRAGILWTNYGYYNDLKKQHPDLYARFKEMKNMLKS